MDIPERGRRGGSIASDSAETLLLKLLLYVMGFAASVVISRGLGPSGRGEYYLPLVTAGTLVAVCKLGLEQANVFLIGTRGIPINSLSGQNGLVAVVMGPLGMLGMLVALLLFPALFGDTPLILLLLAALTIPFSLHAQFSGGLLTLLGQVTWQFRASLLASVVQVALLLGLWLLPWFAVGPVLAVNLATVVLSWALTVWAFRGTPTCWIRWDADLLWNTLQQSLLLHLGMVLFFLHLRLDMFMVKAMRGAAALGQYSLSVTLAETILLATDSLAIAILPRQISNTVQEAALISLRSARMNCLIGVGLGVLWAVTGIPIIRVFFGAQFTPAYLPLVALLPGMVFLGMQRVCGGPALRAGCPGRITGIYAATLLCNAGLNLWWISLWDILGAALASSVSYTLGAVMFLAWTARLAGVPVSDGILPRRSDLVTLWRSTLESLRAIQGTSLAGILRHGL